MYLDLSVTVTQLLLLVWMSLRWQAVAALDLEKASPARGCASVCSSVWEERWFYVQSFICSRNECPCSDGEGSPCVPVQVGLPSGGMAGAASWAPLVSCPALPQGSFPTH